MSPDAALLTVRWRSGIRFRQYQISEAGFRGLCSGNLTFESHLLLRLRAACSCMAALGPGKTCGTCCAALYVGFKEGDDAMASPADLRFALLFEALPGLIVNTYMSVQVYLWCLRSA